MGEKLSRAYDAYFINSDVMPDRDNPPSFDPNFGFPNGRKERVMVATVEEMNLAKVPLQDRGYCAHFYIDWKRCLQNHPFMTTKCLANKEHYMHCRYEDHVLRMKEYEREKRLKMREKRIRERKLQENMA